MQENQPQVSVVAHWLTATIPSSLLQLGWAFSWQRSMRWDALAITFTSKELPQEPPQRFAGTVSSPDHQRPTTVGTGHHYPGEWSTPGSHSHGGPEYRLAVCS